LGDTGFVPDGQGFLINSLPDSEFYWSYSNHALTSPYGQSFSSIDTIGTASGLPGFNASANAASTTKHPSCGIKYHLTDRKSA
jgi:hypothetical protein